MVFFQKNDTPLTCSDSPENWFLDQFDYADFKNQIGFALGDRILELILSAQHFTTFFAEIPFFDKNCSEKKTWHEITLKNAVE